MRVLENSGSFVPPFALLDIASPGHTASFAPLNIRARRPDSSPYMTPLANDDEHVVGHYGVEFNIVITADDEGYPPANSPNPDDLSPRPLCDCTGQVLISDRRVFALASDGHVLDHPLSDTDSVLVTAVSYRQVEGLALLRKTGLFGGPKDDCVVIFGNGPFWAVRLNIFHSVSGEGRPLDFFQDLFKSACDALGTRTVDGQELDDIGDPANNPALSEGPHVVAHLKERTAAWGAVLALQEVGWE